MTLCLAVTFRIHEKIIDELDFIKIKNFCSTKDIKRMRRRVNLWKKHLQKTEKELLSRVYKQLLKVFFFFKE